MSSLSQTDEDIILKVADYPNMPMFSSVILAGENGSWETVEHLEVVYADLVIKLTKNLTGPTFAVVAKAGAFRITTGPEAEKAIQKVDTQILSASSGASVSNTHAEVNAKATLVGGDVSVFNFNLGVGVSTGGGIKDDSLSVKVAGCGVQVGRKLGISVFGNELAIDFGKFFS